MRRTISCSVAALALATLTGGAARAELTKEPFMIRDARSLVDLCGADPKDPLYDDAINFCHGYVSGAWQYHQAQANGPEGRRLVCPPDPVPTRTEAISMFLAWVPSHTQYLSEPAVETFFRFLVEKYPCAAPAAGKKGAVK